MKRSISSIGLLTFIALISFFWWFLSPMAYLHPELSGCPVATVSSGYCPQNDLNQTQKHSTEHLSMVENFLQNIANISSALFMGMLFTIIALFIHLRLLLLSIFRKKITFSNESKILFFAFWRFLRWWGLHNKQDFIVG